MPQIDIGALAGEFLNVYDTGGEAVPPSVRFSDWNLNAGYAVEAAFARLRAERGSRAMGRKVGFANKATWPALKIETVAWARVYDDTVQFAAGASASSAHSFTLGNWRALKIEPEIVFKLKRPITQAGMGPAEVLESVEWLALGFEIIDNPFPGKFAPSDLAAAYGLHRGLVVGEPHAVHAAEIASLVEALGRFPLRLFRDGAPVEEGSGKNVFGSPALCLAELACAATRQQGAEPLAAGEVITTGSLTTPQPIASGQTWRAEAEGLPVASLTVRLL